MIICPDCSHENIEGSSECEQCQQPLADYLVTPSTTIEEGLLTDRIRVLEPKLPVTVDVTTPVGEVLQLMVEKRIGCVVVTGDGQTVGIFSERDALERLGADTVKLKKHPISEFMTKNPRVLDPQAKVAFVVQRMDLGGYRHVPIVEENGNLCGIVSVRDILRYLTEKLISGGHAL